MAGNRPVVTRAGFERLQEQLEALQAKRTAAIEEVRLTRSYGDLRENFGYHAAKQAYGILEGQIKDLEQKIAEVEIVEQDDTFEEVTLGVPVTVKRADNGRLLTYTICDSSELGIVDGGISSASPMGEALIYLRVGDEAEVETPRGTVRMTVVQIGE